eukprot:TRINITY_DN22123_c0_g1_i1.p1 TRINITY_DN22123_c0_g1~~TRINITY_DN22123_c0_g1_i1.p1  ORF type:complete len:519 (+),score=160.49 TRINITY_DN22123_c0_g1_i1:160-1716(+)
MADPPLDVTPAPGGNETDSVDLAKTGYLPIWGMLVIIWCCLVIQWKRHKKRYPHGPDGAYPLLDTMQHGTGGTAAVHSTGGTVVHGTGGTVDGALGTRSSRSVGHSLVDPGANSMPTSIPREWQRGQLLGSGSFGSVYMGIDMATGKQFAVKVVNLRRDDLNRERLNGLVREVNLLAALDHPNIVRNMGVKLNYDSGEILFFMEFISRGSLGSLVRRHGQRMTERAVVNYCRDVVEGVSYLHEKNIIHQDLKGDNILLGENGCKLADFGTSKEIRERGNKTQDNAQGTPLWMAPEAIKQSDSITLRADIWSLGCVICELLNAGKPPWPVKFETTWQAMYTIGNWAKPLPPNIPSGLRPRLLELLKMCFNPNPKKRASIADVRQHPWIRENWELDHAEDGGMGSANVTIDALLAAKDGQATASFGKDPNANGLASGQPTRPAPRKPKSNGPIPLSPSAKDSKLLAAANPPALGVKKQSIVGAVVGRMNSTASLEHSGSPRADNPRSAGSTNPILPPTEL